MPVDRLDEADAVKDAATVAAALEALGYATEMIALDLDLGRLDELARRKPVVVFNMVESLRGDARLAHMACAVLDHLGLAYTGARTLPYLLTSTKLTAKELMRAQGLPTPVWWTISDEIRADARVIVKAVNEHASLGIDGNSVVPGDRAHAEIAAREQRFGFRFFAEDFVDGREFNVSVLEDDEGPRILPIPEMTFDGLPPERPRIVDYDAKWVRDTDAYDLTIRRFGCEAREPDLARRLSRLVLGCWRAFGLTGYARVDFRVGSDHRPTILEVNVNPCLAPDAGLAAAAAEAGLTYADLIGKIVRAATTPTLKAA